MKGWKVNDLDVSSRDLILKYYLDIFLERQKNYETLQSG
jgi:hypothetical protein